MTLGEKQRLFSQNVALLILFAGTHGFGITFGEAWRRPGLGIKGSLHESRLAIDLNLFLGTKWLKESSDHAPLGAFWKSLHPLNRWGGDFPGDGGHYSIEHNGTK